MSHVRRNHSAAQPRSASARARHARLNAERSARGRTRVVAIAIASALAILLLPVLLIAATWLYYSQTMDSPQETAGVGASTAYDRNGERLHSFVYEREGLRDPVPLTEISPYLIAATIATEDASFFDNSGVNVRGVMRAAWENLTPFGNGFLGGSGGSSITQQLVKNIYISPGDRTSTDIGTRANRKLKETAIALELKRRYSDNQILTWYLNEIYYGNFAYGIEAAARQFFGKDARDLTLAEAAYLAGLPQAPSHFTADPAAAGARQETVLDLMIRHLDEINSMPALDGSDSKLVTLTAEEIEAARNEQLSFAQASIDSQAPHWNLFVQDEVTAMCHDRQFDAPDGIPCDKVVANGALHITTSLDLGLNRLAEQAIQENIAASEAVTIGHNGSLVAIDPKTGQVLAYVGSRDYLNEEILGQVDIASSQQSMGSTMKMFTYLTAFEEGWVPSSYIEDSPVILGEGEGAHTIENWNLSHQGRVTLRTALSESINTTAVRLVNEVGTDSMKSTAHDLGIIDLQAEDCGPTITLGACEVRLIDQTYAFSVLANNGALAGRDSTHDSRPLDFVSVLEIKDADGNVLYTFQEPQTEQVVDPAFAYMVTDILSRDAISWSQLEIGRPAAAKTGTSEEFRDAVIMGYTPNLTVGVWMGNADNSPMAEGTFSGQSVGPIWTQFMMSAVDYLQLPPDEFQVPDSIETENCAGRTEIFKRDAEVTRPGACRGTGSDDSVDEEQTPDPTEAASPEDTAAPSRTATPGVATSAPTADPGDPVETPPVTDIPGPTAPLPTQPTQPTQPPAPAPTVPPPVNQGAPEED